MKCALTLADGGVKPGAHDLEIGVVRKLKVVDTSHDAREVVIRRVGWFTGFADDREHWCQRLET